MRYEIANAMQYRCTSTILPYDVFIVINDNLIETITGYTYYIIILQLITQLVLRAQIGYLLPSLIMELQLAIYYPPQRLSQDGAVNAKKHPLIRDYGRRQ